MLGVAGEVQFSMMVFRRDKELKRRSDEKVAQAQLEAAEARARTAEVEKLTAWRRITPSELEHFLAVIGPIANTISLWLEFQNSDLESLRYAQDIGRTFEKAGVANIGSIGNSFLFGGAFGLCMTSDGVNIDTLKRAFEVFTPTPVIVAGSLATKPTNPAYAWRPNLYVFVGPKIPPEMFGEDAPQPMSLPPA